MPAIRDRLNEDMKTAMRGKSELRLSTIRMIRSEILYKDKEHGKDITEDDILKLLQTMVKKREEAAEQYAKGGRVDLAAKEREEIEIVQNYLPAQIGDDELRREVRAAITETGAASLKEMGKVMALLTKKLAGRAASARISGVVKEMLAG